MRRIWRRLWAAPDGFTVAELVVVCGIIGILSAISAPYFLSYLQAARVKAAAEEVAAYLNQARQLAISSNENVCVLVSSTAMRYLRATCAGAVWTGAGTDASGNIRVPEGISLTTSANPVFTYLGNATPDATYTLQDTQSGKQLQVTVAASGRVRIIQ